MFELEAYDAIIPDLPGQFTGDVPRWITTLWVKRAKLDLLLGQSRLVFMNITPRLWFCEKQIWLQGKISQLGDNLGENYNKTKKIFTINNTITQFIRCHFWQNDVNLKQKPSVAVPLFGTCCHGLIPNLF